ncbi:hypothetical protein FSHL1_001681 [Fusarium sambucinum]
MEETKIPAHGADAKHSVTRATIVVQTSLQIGLERAIRVASRSEAKTVADDGRSAGCFIWVKPTILLTSDANAGCFSTRLEILSKNRLTKDQIEAAVDTDHNPDLQYATALLQTAMTGILPNGTRMKTQAINYKVVYDYWEKGQLPKLPSAGSSRTVKTPNDYFMDRFGSYGNRAPFFLLDRNLNQVKGRIFNDGASVQDPVLFAKHLKETIRDGNGHDAILNPIKWIEGAMPQFQRLHEIHQEFDYNWYLTRTDDARDWVIGQLDSIRDAFNNANPKPANYQTVMDAVKHFRSELKLIRPPPEDPKKYH